MKVKSFFMAILAMPFLALFTCCSDDDSESSMELTPKTVSFYHGDEVQMTVNDNRQVSWSVENNYYALVDENGVLTAFHVGSTKVVAKDSKGNTAKSNVTVLAKYNTYKEPCIKWGATKAQVKSFEKRSLDTENDKSLLYMDNGAAYAVLYLFDDKGCLTSSGVLIKTAYATEASKFLLERYMYVREINGMYTLTDESQKLGIIESVYSSNYILITYTNLDSSSNKSLDINESGMDETYRKLLKE